MKPLLAALLLTGCASNHAKHVIERFYPQESSAIAVEVVETPTLAGMLVSDSGQDGDLTHPAPPHQDGG